MQDTSGYVAKRAAELRVEHGGNWDAHPRYPVAEWQAEVAEDTTRQGYWEWVVIKSEEV